MSEKIPHEITGDPKQSTGIKHAIIRDYEGNTIKIESEWFSGFYEHRTDMPVSTFKRGRRTWRL